MHPCLFSYRVRIDLGIPSDKKGSNDSHFNLDIGDVREKGRYFLSPDQKYYARLFGSMDSEKVEFFTVFYNKKKEEIRRIKILEEDPCLYEIRDVGWVRDNSSTFRVHHGVGSP